jgi:uncharacterized protein YqgV (UPF0045/DUF77 family)
MTTIIESTMNAFVIALDEAHELHAQKAGSAELADVIQHAHEVLEILEWELAAQSIEISADPPARLDEMRGRLESLENEVARVRH